MARKREGRESREAGDSELAQTVAELAARIARLEGKMGNAVALAATDDDDSADANAVFALPAEGAMRVLAALSSAPRLALYRAALSGPVTSAELMAAAGLNTTGQLYHHLRELVGVGLMMQEGRDRYATVRERIPAARAIFRAALGVAQIAPVVSAMPVAPAKAERASPIAPVAVADSSE